MKTKILVLSSLFALNSFATIQAPNLVQVERIEIPSGVDIAGPTLFQDSKGNSVLLSVSDVFNDSQKLKITAYGSGANKIAEIEIQRFQGKDKFSHVSEAGFNEKGEIVALIVYGMKFRGRHFVSANISGGKTVDIVRNELGADFLGRIHFKGRNLIAICSNQKESLNGQQPSVLQILDEDTGEVVHQHPFDQSFKGKLGIDQQERLKFLITGYTSLGILDIETGQYRDLLSSSQGYSFPGEVKLSIGTFLQVTDNRKNQRDILLFENRDLINGKLNLIRSYPENTVFVGHPLPQFSVRNQSENNSEKGIVITDLATGKVLGQIPSKNSFVPQSGTKVLDVLTDGTRTLVVALDQINAGLFVPGTVLTYFDAQTGKVLREVSDLKNFLRSRLFFDQSTHRWIALEQSSPYGNMKVVDILKNTEMDQSKRELMGSRDEGIVSSSKGDLFGVYPNIQNQICVFALFDFSKETCIQDPLINEGSLTGYKPYFRIEDNKITIPLLSVKSDSYYSSKGFAQFEIQ